MNEHDWLAGRFEESRARLLAVAYRMLGSPSDADDAVQETWLRLSRSGTSGVANLEGWLTTVTARVCLDILRSRKSRREEPLGEQPPGPAPQEESPGPEHEALLADSVGLALLVVLDTLTPAERVAFVLHDMFDVPFSEIGPVVGRSADAAKMLASRARRRVRGAEPDAATDTARQREVVTAFLAASRGGDFEALLALLDPDVVMKTDEAAAQMGAPALQGAQAVAGMFSGRAQAARLVLVDGLAGAAWTQRGQLQVVFRFTLTGGRITAIDLVADRDRLGAMEVGLP